VKKSEDTKMFNIFSRPKRSDKIIHRYIDGVVNEQYRVIVDFHLEPFKFVLKKRLFNAIKDFLIHSELLDDEKRDIKEIEIYAKAHNLSSKAHIDLFIEVLELVISNKTVILENHYLSRKSQKLLSKRG